MSNSSRRWGVARIVGMVGLLVWATLDLVAGFQTAFQGSTVIPAAWYLLGNVCGIVGTAAMAWDQKDSRSHAICWWICCLTMAVQLGATLMQA